MLRVVSQSIHNKQVSAPQHAHLESFPHVIWGVSSTEKSLARDQNHCFRFLRIWHDLLCLLSRSCSPCFTLNCLLHQGLGLAVLFKYVVAKLVRMKTANKCALRPFILSVIEIDWHCWYSIFLLLLSNAFSHNFFVFSCFLVLSAAASAAVVVAHDDDDLLFLLLSF